MDPAHQTYEAFLGLVERPFSLTPDPKYYFRSRAHSRAFDALSAGIDRRDGLLLLTGDLGVGKTTLCRTLMASRERKTRMALVGDALVSPEDLLRLLLQDLGAVARDESRISLVGVTRSALVELVDAFLLNLQSNRDSAVLIIDEAQNLPATTAEQIVELTALESNRDEVLQVLFAAQPAVAGGPVLPGLLDERIVTRARLLPLERDESERYVHQRLTIAGGAGVTFSAKAMDVIYGLSGGVPRLVNLLADRALHEGAAQGARRIEPAMIEAAASSLQLLRLRPKRFRWFGAHTR